MWLLARSLCLEAKPQPLATGTFHLIYRLAWRDGRPAILRCPVSDLFDRDAGLAFEGAIKAWFAGSAAERLLPETVQIGFHSEGAPFDYAILEEAPGHVLRDLGDEFLDQQPRYLSSVGEALRSIHDRQITGAGPLDEAEAEAVPRGLHSSWADYIFLNLERHIAACNNLGLINDLMADKIATVFERMANALNDRPCSLLHGDPGTHNICVETNTLTVTRILDWEDALAGDPLFDVAMFSSFQPARRLPFFLQGYGLSDPSPEEQRLLALYFLRIALCKTVHRARFGITDKPGRIPAHQRIYRGLHDLEALM